MGGCFFHRGRRIGLVLTWINISPTFGVWLPLQNQPVLKKTRSFPRAFVNTASAPSIGGSRARGKSTSRSVTKSHPIFLYAKVISLPRSKSLIIIIKPPVCPVTLPGFFLCFFLLVCGFLLYCGYCLKINIRGVKNG